MPPALQVHTHTQSHGHLHTCRYMQVQCVHVAQTHVRTQAMYHTHLNTCTKTQPPYTWEHTHCANRHSTQVHVTPPSKDIHTTTHIQIPTHTDSCTLPCSSPKSYRAVEARASLAIISSPASQSRVRAQGWRRVVPEEVTMSIPGPSSDPGCLFSSQIPPCGPQLRPAGSTKPW